MKNFLFLILVVTACVSAPARAADTRTPPQDVVRELVARERELFGKSEADPNFDPLELKSQLQQIANAYEELIKRAHDYAPAYVAYGQLLEKIDMSKEAVVVFLKANELDRNNPVVKNGIGKYLAESGKPLNALPYFLAAVDLAPKESLYHFQVGTLIAEAKDDFLKTGDWKRTDLDKTMLDAFRNASELAPENFGYAYRAAEAYGELEVPKWDEALNAWRALESLVKPGLELQTIQLQEANVLIKQEKYEEARKLIGQVDHPTLQTNKQTLIDAIEKKTKK